MATLFDAADFVDDKVRPSYNLAPMQQVPVVRTSRSAGGRVVDAARWGLTPSWSKDPKAGARMINARVETVATSPAYRAAFARRRCLVPADGWYEWRRLPGGGKQPYFMTADHGAPVVFAGLWELWGEGEQRLLTCTVLTRPAVGGLESVHDRMPMLLSADDFGAWLAEPSADGVGAEAVLRDWDAALAAEIEVRPVGKAVGNVRNDSPELVERVDVDLPATARKQDQPGLF